MSVFAVLAIVPPQSVRAEAPPRYRLIDLGPATGCAESAAVGVTQTGSVLVLAISGAGHRTFIWKPGKEKPDPGSIAEVELPGAEAFYAKSFNDYGQILFHRRDRTPIDGGLVLWTPNEREGVVGSLTGLQKIVPGRRLDTEGFLANDGSVLSHVSDPKVLWLAIKWTPDRPNATPGQVFRLEDRGTKKLLLWPIDVNDQGWVVGGSHSGDEGRNLWRPDLKKPGEGTLHGVAPPDDPKPGQFKIAAISNNNTVVGTSVNSAAYLFRVEDDMGVKKAHKIERLPELPRPLEPKDVNDAGTVVGLAGDSGFLWTEKTGTHALTSLIEDMPKDWHLFPRGMNGKGWIVGMAYTGKMTGPGVKKPPPRHAFLLVPIEAQ